MFTKVPDCLVRFSLVNDASLQHQQQVIELLEDVRVCLMDRHDDCFVPEVGEVAQVLHNDEGSQ